VCLAPGHCSAVPAESFNPENQNSHILGDTTKCWHTVPAWVPTKLSLCAGLPSLGFVSTRRTGHRAVRCREWYAGYLFYRFLYSSCVPDRAHGPDRQLFLNTGRSVGIGRGRGAVFGPSSSSNAPSSGCRCPRSPRWPRGWWAVVAHLRGVSRRTPRARAPHGRGVHRAGYFPPANRPTGSVAHQRNNAPG